MLLSSPLLSLGAADVVDLSGPWRVQLDAADEGAAQRWFARELSGETVRLPGSLQDHRLGDPVTFDARWTGSLFDKSYFTAPDYAPYREPGNIKVPFWLQPETLFTGAAWYQREIELPPAWQGKHVTLHLERPHWKTTVWLDDRRLGAGDSLSVPHEFPLGAAASPGRHRLTIRIDNTLEPDLGENSHSVSDHTQGNWNGVIGRIELRATAPVWIERLAAEPRVAGRRVTVRGQLARVAAEPWPATVRVGSSPASGEAIEAAVGDDGAFVAEYSFPGDAPLWDEFSPALHAIRVALPNGETRETTFGFREIAADGRQLMINGRKLFLRGTLDCAAFPRTGHPPTGVAEWRRVFGVIQAHGLNHVRFHSWCPPEAAFVAADELGVYLQIEAAAWPNQSTTLGDGKPVDAWLEAETDRIRRAYGHHPSFVLFCAGNEPGGDRHATWLSAWLQRHRARDPHRLYTAGSGWPEVPENQFHVRSEPRIQQWGQGLASRINALPPETRTDYGDFIRARALPVVSHEIGQWCVFPNFAEMPKYTGYLKPRNFEIFRKTLAAHGLGEQAHEFMIASGKLQALCYKEDIESALRTPEMGGFQLLGLQDFPGQGTALVGVLDAFWEEKGYIAPAEFRRFCNSTVPLARLARRVFASDERLTADLEVAHFGPAPLQQVFASWRLESTEGVVAASGKFPAKDLAVGAAQPIGRIDVPLAKLAAPAQYRLAVAIDGTEFANDWDVWVYPNGGDAAAVSTPGITLASDLNAAVEARLAAGETVWLMLPPAKIAPDPQRGPIALGFSSIFWNTAWTNRQAPHTLGIFCDPDHPALAAFPTEGHSNWQWWYVVTQAAPMLLDALPTELRPTVQVIDDWFTSRRLALAFEARVGPGRLLVTSVDLTAGSLDPVRRQLRASLLAYASSERFQPQVDVSLDQLRTLLTPAAE